MSTDPAALAAVGYTVIAAGVATHTEAAAAKDLHRADDPDRALSCSAPGRFVELDGHRVVEQGSEILGVLGHSSVDGERLPGGKVG